MIDEVSKATGAAITIGENLPDGVGVVAETTDGHRQLNNTLSNRLHRQQDNLRAAVYHILMGEMA
jgi:vacuolar-type H+-ATPase subunit E/Vma4